MQIFLQGLYKTSLIEIEPQSDILALQNLICEYEGVPCSDQSLILRGKRPKNLTAASLSSSPLSLSKLGVTNEATIELRLRGGLQGGMDFQNRVGHKTGSGQVSRSQEQVDRRERLRKLAMETIDVSKDPYFMRNHLGKYECKLCLTLHNNEGNYLAHTQGKRHQTNLARRAAREARDAPVLPQPVGGLTRVNVLKNTVKIGRPGYKVTKQRDPETQQRSLLFEIDYPEIEENMQPRHRFMSAFEQKIEPPNKDFQYLLFAAAPYETIGFKIPNLEVDKSEGKFVTEWNAIEKKFTLQLFFSLT
eukprot:g5799.t1